MLSINIINTILILVTYLIPTRAYDWAESQTLAAQSDADSVLVVAVFCVLGLFLCVLALAWRFVRSKGRSGGAWLPIAWIGALSVGDMVKLIQIAPLYTG